MLFFLCFDLCFICVVVFFLLFGVIPPTPTHKPTFVWRGINLCTYSASSSSSTNRQRRGLTAASVHDLDPACLKEGDLDLVQSKRHILHEELLLYSSMESSFSESDAIVIRRARRLLMYVCVSPSACFFALCV